jgi:HSP20 family protein
MNIIHYQPDDLQIELSTPFARLATTLREEMDQLLRSSFGSFFSNSGSVGQWSPAIDVYQNRDQFTVVAELPGVKKEEIEISFQDNALTISGERKWEEGDQQAYRSERFFGRFQRTISLPAAVDSEKITATYQDGVLKVVLPKSDEAKPQQIEVLTS